MINQVCVHAIGILSMEAKNEEVFYSLVPSSTKCYIIIVVRTIQKAVKVIIVDVNAWLMEKLSY